MNDTSDPMPRNGRDEASNGVKLITVEKERVTILVESLDEGVKCWRPVSAEHLSGDTYQIRDAVPEGESWLFRPGDIVCCQQREFSDGTGLTAYELVSIG